MTLRRIILCADDAGWSEATDRVIADHAMAGQISAVSVLVRGPNAPYWKDTKLPDTCSLGLHLSLTWSPEYGSRDLGGLIVRAFARRLPSSWVRAEVDDQIDRFAALFGRLPDFVDGHQHVHILPGIREALFDVLGSHYPASARPAIRSPLSHRWRGIKAAGINRLGAKSFDRQLKGGGWATNLDFAGVYDLSTTYPYRERMRSWLATIQSGGLIMVHPGCADLPEHGPARAAEAAYLASTEWARDREEESIQLFPFTTPALKKNGFWP